MNDDKRGERCTWCRGKGYITRENDPTPTSKGRWIGLITVILSFTVLSITGGASGWWALIAIPFLVGIFVAQFIGDIVEEIGFWRSNKAVCPHCGGNSKDSGPMTN